MTRREQRLSWGLLLAFACVPAACKSSSDAHPGDPAPEKVAPVDPVAPPVDDATAAADDAGPAPVVLPAAAPVPPPPRGLPPTPSPAHNPTTPEKVALGQLLFFDPRLSSTGAKSCADCHDPAQGWADGVPRSKTVAGKLNLRHTPTLYNVAYHNAYFWDGRLERLEPMILANWKGQLRGEPNQVAAVLARIPVYRAHFERAFGKPPSGDRIADALAAYVRTIRSGDAPWDRYEDGDAAAVSAAAIAGYELYQGAGQCAVCHPPPLFSDRGFHDVGVPHPHDPGRAGAFKTPTLRGAAHTAPYFHDGSAATLAEAIRRHRRDAALPPLTEQQIDSLVAFVRSLSPDLQKVEPPTLPPNPPVPD